MLSFELKGGIENGVKFSEVKIIYVPFEKINILMSEIVCHQSMKIATLAVSLGGVESLICHPASTTHNDRCVTPEAKKAGGITDTLLRLR